MKISYEILEYVIVNVASTPNTPSYTRTVQKDIGAIMGLDLGAEMSTIHLQHLHLSRDVNFAFNFTHIIV